MVAKNIGESVLRKEDARFITGKGNYTDDINLRGQAHAFFVRAPVARAMITSLDCSAAEAADGVVAVLTGAQVAEDGLGSLPCGWMVLSKDGSEMKQPPHPQKHQQPQPKLQRHWLLPKPQLRLPPLLRRPRQ